MWTYFAVPSVPTDSRTSDAVEEVHHGLHRSGAKHIRPPRGGIKGRRPLSTNSKFKDEKSKRADDAAEPFDTPVSGGNRTLSSPTNAINPLIGAVHTHGPDRGKPQEVARLSHYLSQTLFQHLFEGFKERKSWITVLNEYPILFHAYSHASAVHKDVLLNKVIFSNTGAALHHKGQSIKLLNQALSNLDGANLEILLIVMVTLATHDVSDSRLYMGTPMGFRPHEARAYWMNVYGRLDTIPEHLGAIARLIELTGGLEKIKLPGLGNCLALTDMMVASINFAPPSFPPYWKTDPLIMSKHPQLLSDTGNRPGRGFSANIPGGLPSHTDAVFTGLATIDRYMAKYGGTDMNDETYRRMMSTRNALHYSVLSLPRWSDLAEDAKTQNSKPEFYEIARISTVLYSSAVIFGLPPHRNWHLQLVSQLRDIIKNATALADEAPKLLLWTLCVGALAAFQSPDRIFFEKSLADLMRKHEQMLPHIEATRGILEDFLWSYRACDESFQILWAGISTTNILEPSP